MEKITTKLTANAVPKEDQKWWHRAIVYQIYPRSFQDSNGDGIGDIRGIITRLDYLQNLGINTIWLNPIFSSPQDDNGYDISDFYTIAPEFGSIADVQELIFEAHARDIKIVFDLVLSHTSDEHPWFVDAKSSKTSRYRDYYLWKSGTPQQKPNNWASFFGGSVWEYNERTEDYYFHLFSKKMPDINWENKKLRAEMYAIANYWTKLGIDGFRMDAIVHLQKNTDFPEEKGDGINPYVLSEKNYANRPEVHHYVQEFYREVLEGKELLTVGEASSADVREAIQYTNPSRKELNMIISFRATGIDRLYKEGEYPGIRDPKGIRWHELKAHMLEWQQGLFGKGWNTLFWNNHDLQRLVSRYGDDTKYRVESAKMLATLMYLQWGVPFLLQGEEIGMTNAYFTELDQYRDTSVRQFYEDLTVHYGKNHREAMDIIAEKSRDNSRTPMQWDGTVGAGFTTGTPWIGINPNSSTIHVENALQDKNSLYYYYQKLIHLKKTDDVCVYGYFELVLEEDPNIYAYTRTYEQQQYLIYCNLTDKQQEVALNLLNYALIFGSYANPDLIILRPYEALVLRRK